MGSETQKSPGSMRSVTISSCSQRNWVFTWLLVCVAIIGFILVCLHGGLNDFSVSWGSAAVVQCLAGVSTVCCPSSYSLSLCPISSYELLSQRWISWPWEAVAAKLMSFCVLCLCALTGQMVFNYCGFFSLGEHLAIISFIFDRWKLRAFGHSIFSEWLKFISISN